jgi:hypothetical protein
MLERQCRQLRVRHQVAADLVPDEEFTEDDRVSPATGW